MRSDFSLNIYAGVPIKLYIAPRTRTVPELFTYEVLLYSSLYLFKYYTFCCFHGIIVDVINSMYVCMYGHHI